MSYTQGGLIEATDYNNLIGSNTSSINTQLNSTWAWGTGTRGWGQTPIAQVSSGGVVTATQWATLINTLNSANTHINGSSSGLTANTAGQLIGFSGSLVDKITGVYSNGNVFASNSAVITNVNQVPAYSTWTFTATGGVDPGPAVRSFGLRVSFNQGPDAARFFFNAGGRLKFNVGSVNSGSTTRSTAINTLFGYLGGISLFGSSNNGGRLGTGGTLSTNNTASGYYQLTSTNTAIVSVVGITSNYTTDTANIFVRSNGTQGSFNDNGTLIDFWVTINSGSGTSVGTQGFDDSFSVTPTLTIDASFPETTNLANTWGAITVTRL